MKKNILALVNGLAGDMDTMSGKLGDSKGYMSDNMCRFMKHFKTPIFRPFEGTIFPNRKHFRWKAYAELGLSQKSVFHQK